ncbi:hypothetical protein FJR73_03115 [Streptococcus sp. D2]|nr:hypothetical protein FJR73_03115 [Streptococcus sp. D2]
MGLNGTILTLGEGGFLLFLFWGSTTKELKLRIKKKNILTTKGKICYNNRRYFLLLVSQECTGTC